MSASVLDKAKNDWNWESGGASSPQGVQGDALVNACMQIPEQFYFFVLIKHTKMVTARVNIG